MSRIRCALAAAVALCLVGCANEPLSNDCLYPPCDCECPAGYECYSGTCLSHPPNECLDPTNPIYYGWPDDSDLEPNDHPDQAAVLPCGDDAVFHDPAEYVTRCPTRQGYTNGYMNLLLCPNGESDFYAIYLLPEESVTFNLLYQYSYDPPRDLDARIWKWDFAVGDWRDDVAVGLSTNDNETLTFTTASGSGNIQGWYYIEVFGKTFADVNFYTLSYTLNEVYYQ